MYDVIIIGGGPAGSTCARKLTRAGARVAIIDRAEFPRVKLCAGWLSSPFWDAIERSPTEYPRGLWPWQRCHVHYRGTQYTVAGRGWFIRRFELDDWLLHESGAELFLGTNIKTVASPGVAGTRSTPEGSVESITRVPDGSWQVGEHRSRYLVGAGGTHCPVARMLEPVRPRRAVGVQELELQTDPSAIAHARLGEDGEPELVLFEGLTGYGWNIPKRDWLNVGCGTLDATKVRDAWQTTHAVLSGAGHIPGEADAQLEHLKGHSYFLFDPAHLPSAYKDGAFLVGDALGLAHPLTAEGIVPAVISGRLCAEAILDNAPATYEQRLRGSELLADYRRVYRVVEAARGVRSRRGQKGPNVGTHGSAAKRAGTLTDRAVAHGFAWLFSGARVPAPRVVDFVLDRLRRSTKEAPL